MVRAKRVGTALCATLALLVAGSAVYMIMNPSTSSLLAHSPIAQLVKYIAPPPMELTSIPAPETRPPEAAIGQTYTVSGYEVTVHDIRVGKTRGSLPLLPVEEMGLVRNETAQLDADGTFQDDHLYVDVELTVKNVSHSQDDKFLATACSLHANSEDGIFYGAEPVASDFTDFTEQGHDAGKVPLAVGESVSGHVGFVVTEDAVSNQDAPLYFTVDVNGLVEQAPEEAGTSWTPVPTEWR